jgi:hypothetical protein
LKNNSFKFIEKCFLGAGSVAGGVMATTASALTIAF